MMKKLFAAVIATAITFSMGVITFAKSADSDAMQESLDSQFALPLTVQVGQWFDSDGNRLDHESVLIPDTTVYCKLDNLRSWERLEHRAKGDQMRITPDFSNDSHWQIKYNKGQDNPNLIKSLKVVDKILGGDATERAVYLEIKLDENNSDNEYKCSPVVTFTTKRYAIADMEDGTSFSEFSKEVPTSGDYYEPGLKVKLNFQFWVKDAVKAGDRDYKAGESMLHDPQLGGENEITWENEVGNIANLTFKGDSDPDKFFVKLSTKWEKGLYDKYFTDRDAFMYNFMGSKTGDTNISSTSRAYLEILNPFYSEEKGNLIVNIDDIVVYKVLADYSLKDITDSFIYGVNKDGDYVLATNTRVLGNYIIST